MKKLLLISITILLFFAANSQPLIYRAGAANTPSDARLQAQYNLFQPRYFDTTAANLNKGIDSAGATIYTYVPAALWVRKHAPKRWEQVGSSIDLGLRGVYTNYGLTKVNDSTLNFSTVLRDSIINVSKADSSIFATLYRVDTAKQNIRNLFGGYVPTSRTLTINGVAQDLSTNRSWTIPAADSSIFATLYRVDTAKQNIRNSIPTQFNSIAGYGQLITGTYPNRTFTIDTNLISTRAWRQKGIDSVASIIPAQFNPIAGTNVTLSGTYPNITFNASGGSGAGAVYADSGLVRVNDSTLKANLVTQAQLDSLAKRTTIVGWGDSFVSENPGYISKLGELSGRYFINKGVAGYTASATNSYYDAFPSLQIYPAIINVGWNDIGTNVLTARTNILTNIASMVTKLQSKNVYNYLVFSVTPQAPNGVGTAVYDTLTAINATLSSIYGVRFADTKTALVNAYNPSIPADVEDFADGLTPWSLRRDSLHLNAAGNLVVANYIMNNKYDVLFDTSYKSKVASANMVSANTAGGSSSVLAVKDSGYYRIGSVRVAYSPNPVYGNLFFGNGGQSLTYTSSSNTSAGYDAMLSVTSGQWNTAIGRGALRTATTSSGHTAIGYYAMYSNTTGGGNTAIGYQALFLNTTGASNMAIGGNALYQSNGSFNIGVGANALYGNTSGSSNIGIGYNSGVANTTGGNNLSIGYQTGSGNSTGAENVSYGNNAARGNTTGSFNTVVGSQAAWGFENFGANSYNVVLGAYAARDIRAGANNNIIIGANTYATTTFTGTRNIIIGNFLEPESGADSAILNIGGVIFGKGGLGYNKTIGTGKIGIKTKTPEFDFDVNGTMGLRNAPAGTSVDSVLTLEDGQVKSIAISASGTSNTNIGSGFRILKPAGQEIKTLFAGTNVTIDSTTNTDGLTISALSTIAINSTPITSGTSGRLLFENSSNQVSQNVNLHWDNTNDRLGIGTATPLNTLDVRGDIRVGTVIRASISDSILIKESGVVKALEIAQNSFLGRVSSGVGGVEALDISFIRLLTGTPNPAFQTLTDGATITWDAAVGGNAVVTLAGTGRTLSITNPVAGVTYIVRIVQDGTGSRTITTWPSGVKWPGGVAPTLSTTAGAQDIVAFYYNGTNYFGTVNLDFQ